MRSTVEIEALTVSAFAARIARAARGVGGATVEGEVQRPQRSRSGMLYFDLTDGEAKLSCKVFRRELSRLAHEPQEGDLVRVAVDRPDFWATAGKLDLIVTDVELAGEGELLRRRAELLKRLRAEGLCDADRRKPLPAFPHAVGVIAGRESDGMSDVIQALQDRFPPTHIVVHAALVQGKSAPGEIIDALARMQEHPLVEAIVVARGGGSVQDLIAFDDERLCRAVFACAKPVVMAIGHTENVPVCNYVTHAAFTPSRSAEMVVPSIVELRKDLALARQALDNFPERIELDRERLAALRDGLLAPNLLAALSRREAEIAERSLRLVRAPARIDERIATIAEQGSRLGVGIARQLADHERDYGRAIHRLVADVERTALRRVGDARRDLAHIGGLIEARDFRRRGFVLVADEDGQPLPSIAGVSAGDRLNLSFRDGWAQVTVDKTKEERT